jgi:HAD superfamily hydrolase (TIGR01509 family)
VLQYIADAKRLGLKLAVASSSDRAWVERHLERLGLLKEFDCIKCAEDVEQVKPNPDLYLAVLDELGLRALEAIALEDSPKGITSAKAAGVFCVAVPNALTRQLATDHADLRLDSLAEVPLEALISRIDKSR